MIVEAEKAVEHGSDRLEAGRCIRNKEYQDGKCRNTGQYMLFIFISSGKEIRDRKSTDSLGNTVVGNVLNVDTKNCILYSSGKLIATVGIDNLIVVETDDAIMICPKNKSQDVKKIVEELKAEHKEELL